MEESESVECAACGSASSRLSSRSVLEPLSEGSETNALNVLASVTGLPFDDATERSARACEMCVDLMRRLHDADRLCGELKRTLIEVCARSRPDERPPKVEEIKVEEVEPPDSPFVPPTPTNFSDSDDEPLYKTKLNALLDIKRCVDAVESDVSSSRNSEQYSCRECNSAFEGKSQVAIHVFSVHRIDPAKDPSVIIQSNSGDVKKFKEKRKYRKRNSLNDISSSKKLKNKKLDSKKSRETNDIEAEPIKTASQLQQRLAIPNLTIKKVPYATHVLQSELSGQKSKEDKLIISGACNSNTILNQLQTAGLQVSSSKFKVTSISSKLTQKKEKSKEMVPCTECSAVLSSKTRYDLHMLKHHANKTPFICEICGAAYKHKKACDIHVGMHKGISPWKCKECDKLFPSKGALSRHEAIHTGTPNYQCDLCGKSFIHTSSFKMHKLSHSGVKPHSCSKCGLALMTKSHLKRHQRVHSGEKRHECDICGKKFSERYNLYAHQKSHDYSSVHRPGKSHNCTLCEATFIRRHLLDKHMEAVHQLVSENKVKQPRNTMNKLLKQQQLQANNMIEAPEIKPDVTVTEIQSKLSPATSHANTQGSSDVKGEVPFLPMNIKESDQMHTRNPDAVNGESHTWQTLVNYHLANDYPLRMHGVDYVSYLNRQ